MNQPFCRALGALLFAAIALPGQAHAQDAAPACKYVELASVPLRYTGPNLEITMTGSINGTPATMLVDTGAWNTVLTRTGTDSRKLSLRNTGKHARGIGGIARIYQARVNEFSAGGAGAGKGTMPVLTDFGYVPSYDAIVGAPFLLQADLEISLATKQLKFFRPLGCDDRFLAYWDPGAIVIPFDGSFRNHQNPHFPVTVNGRKVMAMIDSGAASTSITLGAAKRAGLKLDDPGVTRILDAVGVGERKVPRWRTVFDTFQIGDETVRNAEISVIDHDGDVDVLLGADFLRAHRVLFAMSQQKIYLSYIGGEPFGQRRKLEPWIVTEAEAGNSDAQFVLARMYTRGGMVEKDPALGASWLEKSARGGNPHANIGTGRQLLLKGFPEEGAARLRAALDKLPSHRTAALWLYLARVRSKQADLARSELAAGLAGNDDDWPRPIADFYLGKVNAGALLKAAADEAPVAKARTCQALSSMMEWHAAHGERDAAAALAAQGKAQCTRPAPGAAAPAGGTPESGADA